MTKATSSNPSPMPPAGLRLAQIVEKLGGDFHGNPDLLITGIASLAQAGASKISFCNKKSFLPLLANTKASCVIVRADALASLPEGVAAIVTKDPYLYYANLSQLWQQSFGYKYPAGAHPSAVVHATAQIDPSASIGPLCVVEAGAKIGAHSVLTSRVTVSRGCVVGKHCLLHSGVVIGSDGFGFANTAGERGGEWIKIEQLGAAVLGDHVELGANCCIDRGELDDTIIEDGVKFDNMVHIAHNVRVGKHTAIATESIVAGGTTIGAYCTISGGVVITGHIQIADGTHITGGTVVIDSIDKAAAYTGIYPMQEHKEWQKNSASLRQLSELRQRIRKLESMLKDSGE